MTDETTETTETDDTPTDEGVETPDQGDTFPRSVVEKLRKESAGYREKAKTAETRADELARRLHQVLVQQDGRLADARDLPYRPEHLEDPDVLAHAIESLLEDRPTLASRTPRGDVGQGARGKSTAPVDFSALFH